MVDGKANRKVDRGAKEEVTMIDTSILSDWRLMSSKFNNKETQRRGSRTTDEQGTADIGW
jgi:hypothetical protein